METEINGFTIGCRVRYIGNNTPELLGYGGTLQIFDPQNNHYVQPSCFVLFDNKKQDYTRERSEKLGIPEGCYGVFLHNLELIDGTGSVNVWRDLC